MNDRWTDALLDRMRQTGDASADRVLASLHDDLGIEAVNQVLMTLVRNDTVVPESLPKVVADWLRDEEHWPAPGSESAIRTAEDLFATHGLTVLMLLGFSSLPQTYASKNGSHVLIFTQRLTRDTQRRVMETFQFIMNAMSPGGLSPTGRGLRDAQKVRLMHASIRRFVSAQPDYDKAWGLPVNQEDLVGTLCSFSTVILDGFATIGLHVTAEQQSAWLEAWKVVGRNLGVLEELLPRDVDDARALFAEIRRRQWGQSSSGLALTQAIVGYFDKYMPRLFDGMPATQIRGFAGDACADILGLPPANWTEAAMVAGNLVDRVVHEVEDRSTILQAVGAKVVKEMLQTLEAAQRGGDRGLFEIPLSLRGRWFPDEPDDAPVVDVRAALERGKAKLFSQQAEDGSWNDVNRGGPAMNGMWLAAEGWMGTLSPADRDGAVQWLRTHQVADGGFGDSPGAKEGTLTSTQTVLAGLVCAGVPARDPVLAKARAWSDAHGGFAKADPMTQIFLAMAGLIPAEHVSGPPLPAVLVPGLPRLLARKLQGFYLLAFFEVPAILLALKRGKKRASWVHPLTRCSQNRIQAYLERRQNQGGTWLGVLPVSTLGAAALVAIGLPLDDERVRNALTALRRFVVQGADGLQVQPYTSEVWDTAMSARILIEAGVPVDDPRIRKALAYLRAQQGHTKEPWDLMTPKPGAPREGGWAFEAGNELGLDTDSTGMVLACLAEASAPADASTNQASAKEGLAWLLGMQNPDGGWPAFGWGQASKPRGPIGQEVANPPESAAQIVQLLVSPPAILRDPSTEELTGRVLLALGTHGYDTSRPEVKAAIDFLRAQVWTNNALWGRWTTNFVAASSYALAGLAGVGLPASDPLVDGMIRWLEAMQQDDGGFGESTGTYAEPELAGRGPTTPTQTALATWALVRYGRARTRTVERAVRWLLARQAQDGGWDDAYALSVLVPPNLFYGEDLLPQYLGVQALAAYAKATGTRR